MNKIRINVLARELEVKAHELLDKLPELGVTEKKTHSSSIDEDVAEKLRHIFAGAGGGERAEQPSAKGAAVAGAKDPPGVKKDREEPKAATPDAVRESEPAQQAPSG